jgi:transposase InsO family protein
VEFLPDPLTGLIRAPWLVEVKYREDLWKDWPDYRRKMKAARKYATKMGWKFHILTELEIRTKYLAAIIPYASFLTREAPESVLSQLLATMKELGECTVQDLVSTAFPEMSAEEAVLPLRYLIAKRRIWTDLSKPRLRPKSILRAADAPDPAFCWGVDGPPMRTRQKIEKPKPVVPGSGAASFRIEPGINVSINGRPATIMALGGFKDTWVKFHDTGARELAPNSAINPSRPMQPVRIVMPDLLSIADADLSLAEKRLEVLSPLLSGHCCQLDVLEAADKLECSSATVYRFLAKYRQTGLLTSLLPTKPNGGRGKSRTDDEVLKIMDDMIETYYLTPQKPSVKATYRKITKRCGDLNLVAPHLNTLRNRISLIGVYETTKRRQTTREARERFDVTRGSFPGANKPYECIEIDHTPTDVLLVDPETGLIIGRACLTVAIDVFSRMVVGYQVSLDAPSNMVAGLCLANAVLPKDKWIEKYGIKSEWPCVGKPKNLHLDNAGEFSGSYMETLCSQYGIAIHWRPLGETAA